MSLRNKIRNSLFFVIQFTVFCITILVLVPETTSKALAVCPPRIGGYATNFRCTSSNPPTCTEICGSGTCTISPSSSSYYTGVGAIYDYRRRPCGGYCESIACQYTANAGWNVTCASDGQTYAVSYDQGTFSQVQQFCLDLDGTYQGCVNPGFPNPNGDFSYCGSLPASVLPPPATNTPAPTNTTSPGSGNISASPNPCYTSGSQCTTGLFWSTSGVSSPAVKRNGITISSSATGGNFTQWIDVGSPATFTLENTTTGTVLSSVTVSAVFQPAATNTPIPPPTNTPPPGATNTPLPPPTNTPLPGATNTPLPGLPTGNISASPNPCTSSSSSTPCSTNLTWTTQNSLAVSILKNGSIANVVASGLNGSQTVWISPNDGNVTYDVYEANAHMMLASVTVSAVVSAPPTPIPTPVGGNCDPSFGSWRCVYGGWPCNAGEVRQLNCWACGVGGDCCCDPNAPPPPPPIATSTPVPTATPLPTFSIFGGVFIDTNNNKLRDNGESIYSGNISITSSRGSVSVNNGSFSISGLTGGSVTVSLNALPANYNLSYPLNGPPPSYNVTVGSSCSTDTTTGSSCSAGNINNLLFAISNVQPWIQFSGMNVRMDNGFSSDIPPTPSCFGPYASIPNASTNMPGVIFTGDGSPQFGNGNPSTTNWVIGGTNYPDIYRSKKATLLTSYLVLSSIINNNGIPVTDITSLNGCSALNNCDLPNNLSQGVYKANSDLTLQAHNFRNNNNYIFLINGTLRINGQLQVPSHSTAIFSASQNIIIDRSVGSLPNCSTNNEVEGIYSADNNVVIDGVNNCLTGTDLMLKVGGTVIVNAGLNGGRFINNRNLCASNALYPSVLFSNRLDFLFNLPEVLKTKNLLYQEVAP